MLEIPTSFELMGQTIKVVYVDDLVDVYDCYGRALTAKNVLQLQTPKADISDELLQATFFHEFMHFVLEITGYHELNKDEQLVDLAGHAIFQLMKTSKFEESLDLD